MKNVRNLVSISIITAIYVVLTIGIAPLSYGEIQFRFSEALILLVFFKKEYGIAFVLGCFIANIFSPLGWVDMVFGTLASLIAVTLMRFTKNLFVASLIPTLCCVIIGAELSIVFDIPFFLTCFQVMIGEFVVVTVIGYPIFKMLSKNKAFMEIIGIEEKN